MFTGIISGLGVIEAIHGDGQRRLNVRLPRGFPAPELGDSVACNGVCLTAARLEDGCFSADISPETLRATTAGWWQEGAALNLEAALKVGDKLGGHFVSGHVDAVGRVKALEKVNDYWNFTFSYPRQLAKFIAPKGSIAVDGVSLTVNAVTEENFTVMIVPHTFAATLFHHYAVDTAVNLEIDLLARYAARASEIG